MAKTLFFERSALDNQSIPLDLDDEVILFLKRLSSNKFVILGGSQGKYYIEGNNAVNVLSEKNMNLIDLETEIIS